MTQRMQHCPLCKNRKKFDLTELIYHIRYDCKELKELRKKK